MLDDTDITTIRTIVREELSRSRRRAPPRRDDAFAALPAALEGRERVTLPDLLAALGYDPPSRSVALAVRLGLALRALGWSVVGREGSGRRERVYGPPAVRRVTYPQS